MEDIAIQDESFNNYIDVEPKIFLDAPVVATPAFYPIPKYHVVLQELKEFTTGNDAIALFTGALSSGKTTSLKILQLENPANVVLMHGFSKTNLLQTIAATLLALPFEHEKIQEINPSSLAAIIESSPLEHTFIIDDADFLSLENLQSLVVSFSSQLVARVKLILAGEDVLSKRLAIILEKNNLVFSVPTFSLSPLTLKETKQFLKDYICQSMTRGKKLLAKKNLSKIYSLSEGYLGRINRVALQFESEREKKHAFNPRSKKIKTQLTDLLMAVGIVVLLCLIAIKVFLVVTTSTTSLAPAKVTAPRIVSKEVEQLSFIPSIAGLPEERFEIAAPVVMKSLPSHSSLPRNDTLKKGVYTIQLLAARNRQDVLNWLATSKSNNYRPYLHIRSNGKDAVLVYGAFTSKEAARKAMSQLPSHLQINKPWVRPLSQLK